MIEARHVHEAFDRFGDWLALHREKQDGDERSDAIEALWASIGLGDRVERVRIFEALNERIEERPALAKNPATWGAFFMLAAANLTSEPEPVLTDDDFAALLEGS